VGAKPDFAYRAHLNAKSTFAPHKLGSKICDVGPIGFEADATGKFPSCADQNKLWKSDGDLRGTAAKLVINKKKLDWKAILPS
jgi:hypothetical protein